MQALLERITIDRDVCSGKPTVRDTRVLVEDVLEALAAGISAQEILTSWYPLLDEQDIEACRIFAQSNKEIVIPV